MIVKCPKCSEVADDITWMLLPKKQSGVLDIKGTVLFHCAACGILWGKAK